MYLPKNLGKGGMFVEIYLNWHNEATTITMDVNLFISKFSNYAKNMHTVFFKSYFFYWFWISRGCYERSQKKSALTRYQATAQTY